MERLKAQWSVLPSWQKTVVLAVVPVILMGVIWYYLIGPTKQEIESLKSQESQLKAEIEKLKKLADPKALEPLKMRIVTLKKVEEDLLKELEKEVGKIPTEEDLDEVLRSVYRISKVSKVALMDAKFDKPAKVIYEIRTVEGKKVISEKKQTARGSAQPRGRQPRGRKPPAQQPQPAPAVEFYKAELKLSIRGKTNNIFRFMKLLEEKGMPSYPVSIALKPEKENILKADIVLVLILQKKEHKEGV